VPIMKHCSDSQSLNNERLPDPVSSRHHTLGRTASVMVLMFALLVSSSGCFIIPGDPLIGAYVVNRDGVYYAGVRCMPELAEVGVLVFDQASGNPTFDLSGSFWRAVADSPGVAEFELFASNQSGVTVVADDETVVTYPGKLIIRTKDFRGHRAGMVVTLSEVGPGVLTTGGAWWDPEKRFWERPNSDYGC